MGFFTLAPVRIMGESVIDTATGWNNSLWVGPIGENLSTIGQTFTVPAFTPQLESFSFWIGVDDFGPLRYAAYVAAWEGTRLTGPLLFETGLQTLPGSGGPRASHFITFNTGGIQLNPAAEYIAFVSTSAFQDDVFDQGVLGFRDADLYPGGQAFYQNNGSDFALLSQNPWVNLSGSDLAFRAGFAVPEPRTLWMALSGALLIFLSRRWCTL